MRRAGYREMLIGGAIVISYLFWGLGWILTGGDEFLRINLDTQLLAPLSENFLFGTDIHGRSLLSVVSKGLSYTLGVAFSVSIASLIIGVLVGFLMTSKSKTMGSFFETLTNMIFVVPNILIAILVMSVMGESVFGLIGALVITGWPGYARIARGEILRAKSLDYVESTRSIGASNFYLIAKTLLPEISPVMLVQFILGFGGVIMTESVLGFLGLGASPYSWGNLLSVSKTVLLEAPFMLIIVSLVLGCLLIGLNLLGDGLRDYLDPKNRG